MGGAITLTKGDGRTNVWTLAVSHHVLEFEACSARPASKVLRWTLAGYSGFVVRRLSRGILFWPFQFNFMFLGQIKFLLGPGGPAKKKNECHLKWFALLQLSASV